MPELRPMEAVMSSANQKRGFRSISGALTAAVLLLGAAIPARAHMIPVADLIRGITVTQAQCAALPQAVWVNVTGREFCIRYYLSTAGGEGTRPAVFLQGDRLGKLNLKTGEYTSSGRDKDLDTDDFVRAAEALSRQTKGPAIYLARPGLDGSSGDHRIRHTVLELNVTNAALDAIKKRHGFDGLHLIGQSGGAMLVGGMLALRSDIGCAVIGSGRLASERPPRRSPDPGADYYNVADAVSAIAQKRSTRILLVTDPAGQQGAGGRRRPASCGCCGRPAGRPIRSWWRRRTRTVTVWSPTRGPPLRAAFAARAPRRLRANFTCRSRTGSPPRPQRGQQTTAHNHRNEQLAGKHDRQRDDRAVRRTLGPAEFSALTSPRS